MICDRLTSGAHLVGLQKIRERVRATTALKVFYNPKLKHRRNGMPPAIDFERQQQLANFFEASIELM